MTKTNLLQAMFAICILGLTVLAMVDEPKTGERKDTLLYIRTVPPGAKILLDGKELGKSDDMFSVPQGVRKIIIELEGYKPESKEVTIKASEITRLVIALKPQSETAPATTAGDGAQLSQEGWQLWQSGKMVEAAAKFRQAVKLAPDDANAWNGLGWALFNSGKQAEAQQAFEKAVGINPDHPAALNGLGQLYFGARQFDLAERDPLKAAPHAPAAWYGLAKLYLLQEKYEEAEKFAQRIEDSGQTDELVGKMLQAAKEKKLSDGLRAMIEPPSPPSSPATAAAEKPSTSEAAPKVTDDKVVEGVGWGPIRLGATREELAKVYGPLEPTPGGARTGWYAKHHIDFWFDENGRAVEIRFVEGFHLPLTSGVKIGSPEAAVLSAYGTPSRVVNERKSKMLDFGSRGVLMWIADDKVESYTVFRSREEPAPAAETPSTSEAAPKVTDDKVVEGVGWGPIRLGATREELAKVFGPLEPTAGGQRLGWRAKHHIDFWFNENGRAVEVQFVEGFRLPLTSGIKIGSSEKEVLTAYGEPDHTVDKGDAAKMLEWSKRGVLLWLVKGKVASFTVMKPSGAVPEPATAATPEPEAAGAKIVEGVGWGDIRVGAKREEVIKALGKPDDDSTSDYLKWAKQHIRCGFHYGEAGVGEVQFNPGFQGALANGIKLGSPEKTLLDLYGKPDKMTENPYGAKMHTYAKKGILFWTYQGKVSQIVVFKPEPGPEPTEAKDD